MKRVIVLLLCFTMVLALASCEMIDKILGRETEEEQNEQNKPNEEHTHTYDTSKWSYDSNNHWYAPTCDCADAGESNKAAHSDANNDGACDVCAYADPSHEHTYSEDWSSDEDNHWHVADCGHTLPNADVAAHVDENEDGICDTCKYVIEVIVHEHTYSSEWSADETYHWHASTCGHEKEVADKGVHNVNAAGKCTICDHQVEEIVVTDFNTILQAAIASNNKIVSGTVNYVETVYDSAVGAEVVVIGNKGSKTIAYTLGNGCSYVFSQFYNANDEFTGSEHLWTERVSEEEYFAVLKINDDGDLTPVSGAAQFLNGYNYTPGAMLAAGYDDTSTLALTISAMYDIMNKNVNVSDAVSNYDSETGVYSFSYKYFYVNATNEGGVMHYAVELFDVEVEFTVDENYVINKADIKVETFRNLDIDTDISYDPETNTVTMLDTASATVYEYSVTQTSGERTYENPYPKSSLIPTDFELSYVTGTEYDDQGKQYITGETLIEGVLTLAKDEYVRLHLGNLIPSTALASFMDTSDFEFSFVNKDTTSTGVLWRDEAFIKPSFSGYMNWITFKVADAGEYTMTIRCGQVTKTIEIVVPGEDELVVPEDTADTKYVVTTDTYGYFDEYTFTAPASGTYTFTLPAGLGLFGISDESVIFDVFGPDADTTIANNVSLQLAEGESFTFAVGAYTKNVVWAIGVSFVAGEVEGGGEEGGEGEGEGGESGTIGNIVGTYAVANGGTLVIKEDGTMVYTNGSVVSNYTYEIDGNNVIYTLNGNDPYDKAHPMASYYGYLEFDENGMPSAFYNNGTSYALTTGESGGEGGEGEDDETIEVVIGTNDVVVTDEDITNEVIEGYVLVVENAGTYSFSSNLLMIQICDSTGMFISNNSSYLEPGRYVINVVTAYCSAAGDYTFTLEYTAPEAGGEDEADGSADAPFELDSLNTTVTANSDSLNLTHYIFVATANGTLTITYPTENNSWIIVTDSTDPSLSDSASEGTSHTFTIVSGHTYIFGIGVWVAEESDPSVTLSFVEGEVGGGEGDEEGGDEDGIVISGSIYDNDTNTITITEEILEADKVYYSFMPYNDGEYSFASDNLFVTAVMTEDGTVIEMNDNGYYVLVSYTQYHVEISAEYIGTAGDYTITPEYQYPLGHEMNPNWLTFGEETTATIATNYGIVWYQFYAGATGTVTVSTSATGVCLGIGRAPQYVLSGETSVSISVTQGVKYYVSIYSEAACDVVFNTAIVEGDVVEDGTANTPYSIVIGDNAYTLEAYGSVWYVYKANANGTLTLTTTTEGYGWYATKDLLSGGFATTGDLSVEVEIGDVVYLYIEEVTWSGNALDFAFTAALDAEPISVYEIINLNATTNLTIAENTYVYAEIYAYGSYIITWNAEGVIVEINGVAVENGDMFESANPRMPVSIKIYAPDYAAVESISVTINEYVEPATVITEGSNTITVTNAWNGTTVEFTASAAGTYVFTAGTNAVLSYDYTNYLAGESFSVALEEGASVSFVVLTEDYSTGDVVVTVAIEGTEVEPEEPEEPEVPEIPEKDLVIGNNSIEQADAIFNYTATEDGVLNIALGGQVMGTVVVSYSVNGGEYTDIALSSNVDVALVAGDKVVVKAIATGYSTVTATWTAASVEPEEPEEPEVPEGTGSGTSADPYIISSLPFEVIFESSHDVYYTYTATEACVLTVTCPAGCYVSGGMGSKDDNGNYNVTLAAGETVIINPWNQGGTAPYTYSFTSVPVTETPDEGGEGEEGGDVVTGEVVTYMSARHASGRYLKVEIDAAAGTMTLTRSNMSGGWDASTSVAEYTYAIVDGVVTVTNVSGQVCTCVFDENGAPSEITWGSAAFEGFAVQ